MVAKIPEPESGEVIGVVNVGVAQEVAQCKAPKKIQLQLCRVQRPIPAPLQDDFKLQSGSCGYVFRYTTGELQLYQLKEDESFSPETRTLTLTANDWSVLRAVVAGYLRELFERMDEEHCGNESSSDEPDDDDETGQDEPVDKRKRAEQDDGERLIDAIGVCDMDDPEPKTLKFIWETNGSTSDHWFYRISVYTPGGVKSRLVMARFNTECGIFQPCIDMTCEEWVKLFDKWGEPVARLFRMSQDYRELIIVKKALFP